MKAEEDILAEMAEFVVFERDMSFIHQLVIG